MPSFRDWLEGKERDWGEFRRALRSGDREAFDELMAMAREHGDACHNQGFPDPVDGVFLSILLEMERRFERLEREVGEVEERLESLEGMVEEGLDGRTDKGVREG